jgi:hypothetical protein
MSQYIDTSAVGAEVEEAIKYFDIRVSQANIDKVVERVCDSIQDGLCELTQDAEEKYSYEESCDELENEKEGLEQELKEIELNAEWDRYQASFNLYAHGEKT